MSNGTIHFKFLSGEIITLDILEDIEKETNQYNPIKFPLNRTKFIKDETMYYVFVEPELVMSIDISPTEKGTYHIRKYHKLYSPHPKLSINPWDMNEHEKRNFYSAHKLNENNELDGFALDCWQDAYMINIKFPMPNSTFYRLYLIKIIDFTYVYIIYMIDMDNIDNMIEEYKKIYNTINWYKEDKYLVLLDCNGSITNPTL
jgi:hypothetical protein